MKIAWAENYVLDLPEDHRFPMLKYELIPQQLIHEGVIQEEEIFNPTDISEELILLTHTPEYWDKLKNGNLSKSDIRKIGFPYSAPLIERECCIASGTIMAALFSLQDGIAFNSAGGTHHSFADRGEGFCLLNDIAIAANYLLSINKVSKILVVDLDVHQGNGTAKIFEQREDVFTFSLHGKNNFPMFKERSDLDIALQDETTDEEYNAVLKKTLPALINSIRPEIIFYQAGVDVLATDKLGKLALTKEGCKERDKLVFGLAKSNNVPVCVSMGGGYSERIADIVDAHCNTFKAAREVYN
ncbi:MAG TPA: histone deacetylase [Cytophagaceae bacterium]|jgi:acetoin utilization deacetylase AcuC-like enzyme